MAENRADAFLRMIRLSQCGRLKVYLGYSAGVGKTYQMLQEGHRLKNEGLDVAIGLLETHGREDIARLAQGLEIVPRLRREYRGIPLEEMDVEAVIARKPQVALVDELAHTNVPGSRNAKRYEDVQEILAAGIHVITTMNVQHLESLYNVVETSVGVKVRERLPDSVLAAADQIVDVDLATEDLRKRIKDGKVYPTERIETALTNFFTPANLERLRELTLRELASQIDLRRRETQEEEAEAAPDQVLVCLSSHGPNSGRLLRYGSRLAGKLNRNWYAIYVQTPAEEATVIDARTQRSLSETLTLAKQLGALVFTYKGEDVADTILRFAKEYRVGHVVVGRSQPKPLWKRLRGTRSVVENLIRNARGLTVIILDTCEEKPFADASRPEAPDETRPAAAAVPSGAMPPNRPSFGRWLSSRRILIWEAPVSKTGLLYQLASTVGPEEGVGDREALLRDILKREDQGSTFFNEGAAFPHVRVQGLARPVVALGVTKAGVSDVRTDKPVEIVFLILSPADRPDIQVRLLAMASRAAQDRMLLRDLKAARTPAEVMEAVLKWESSHAPGPAEGAL